MRKRGKAAGFTLIEALISTVIFVLVLGGIYSALIASISYEDFQKTYAEMQMSARRALEKMSSELRMAGRINNPVVGEISHPYIFTNGLAEKNFASLSHDPATQHLAAGNPAFGDCREIAFKVPQDVDGDGQLTSATTGEIEWSPADISYVLVTQSNGINVLQRRSGTTVTDILASHVERMTIDTMDTDPTIGINEIVITLYMARPDDKGRWLQTNLSACVTMRNSDGS